jgi:hypothetical protein
MDERIIMDLITQVESLGLKVSALEDALINLAGFEKQTEDGSQEGLIRFQPPKPIVEAKEAI